MTKTLLFPLFLCLSHLIPKKGVCFFLFYFFKDWLIDWLLCWVFVSVRGLSLVAASGGHSSSRCAGLSLSRPLLLRSTGSRRSGSVVVAHGPSCSAACGILPDQGLNPCPLHWQADSQPLRHQGSPGMLYFIFIFQMKKLNKQQSHFVCLTPLPAFLNPVHIITYNSI